ncbi:inner centromere protein A-like isoform X2 [Penaeus japonicus]|uniref:inner centromere protein A-like isoform X2 n=1 Tax=Penaeus japonicus TaxID=27405 RepID=UPI001C716AF8|nr:inner centromere protein A-like isoform X2 [Penaeus japonicus]
MVVTDSLYNLYLRAQEKYNDGCNNFEEHFTWLEEVVSAACETFATADPSLLPKTPGVKKTAQRKRPHQSALTDISESPPSKRVSTEDGNNKDDAATPEEAPVRKGRAAARVAQTKTRQFVQQSNKFKLRRPSTPEDPRKRKGTLSSSESAKSLGNKNRSQTQDEPSEAPSSPSRDEQKSQAKVEVVPVTESKTDVAKPETPPRDSPKKARKSSSPRKSTSDVRLEEEEEVKDEVNLQLNLSEKEDENMQEVNAPECTQYDLRLEDSEENKSEEENRIDDMKYDDDVFESMEVEMKDDKSSVPDVPDCVASNVVSVEPENSAEEDLTSSSKPTIKASPAPKARSTRTKQNALQLSSTSEESEGSHKISSSNVLPPPVPKPRSTRTKQKRENQPGSSSDETSVPMLPPVEMPKQRTTRTKTRAREPVTSESERETLGSQSSNEEEVPALSPVSKKEELPKRSTRTKVKQTEGDREERELIEVADSPKPRSTRTKKRQVNETPPKQQSRTTRTKRRKVEENENEAPAPENKSLVLTLSDSEGEEEGKTSQTEEVENVINVKAGQGSKTSKRDHSVDSVSSEASVKSSASTASFASAKSTNSVISEKPSARAQGGQGHRVTRSKVRQLPNLCASPKNANIKKGMSPAKNNPAVTPGKSSFTRGCCTPKSESGTPKGMRVQQIEPHARSPVKYSPRPFASKKTANSVRDMATAYQNYVGETLNEIEEVIATPVRVTRHSHGNAGARTPDSRGPRINPTKTPSPQCPAEKIIRPKIGSVHSGSSTYGSSGRVTPKTFSRIRPVLASSNEYAKTQRKVWTPTEVNRTRAIMTTGTPNEAKRTKNIISGVTSFIKMAPSKPSREEMEEKKQMEMLKKREREEESRRKKEELLKSKAEDQRRRNEERMRRVQEAREERERKAVEAKEQQERDRKLRDERLKEEQQRKKQQLLAKKRAEEEARIRKIKEQQEEDERRRQQEEERRIEEERKMEEARKAEEERRAYLAEQKRLHEEEKKRRIAEAERILRERKEMENLRLREAERIAQLKMAAAAGKKVGLNDTYTASDNKENSSNHNSTFTKTSGPTQGSSQGNSGRSNSYEMTPETKKPKKLATANNYDINDIKSDDSTDDESAPKKRIPPWAQGSQLKLSLINQEYYPPAMDGIFPPEELLTMPDLSQIFSIQRRRFFKRTSSAIWNTPPSKLFESY